MQQTVLLLEITEGYCWSHPGPSDSSCHAYHLAHGCQDEAALVLRGCRGVVSTLSA